MLARIVEPGPVDGAAVQAGGRAGLEAAEVEAQAPEGVAESDRRLVPYPPGGNAGFADVDQTAQKGARGDDHGGGGEFPPVLGAHPGQAAVGGEHQVVGPGLDNRQVLGFRQDVLHGQAVQFTVGLRPGAPDRRALGLVEHTELNTAAVDGPPHDAVKGIDLAHQLALGQTPDRRIAGHFADCRGLMGQQQRRGPLARRRRGRLGSGVPAAHHNDVESPVHGPPT